MTTATPQGYKPLDSGPITEPTAAEFETDRRDELLEPIGYQERFLTYGPTYHAFVSGIGAGKTTALIQRIALNTSYWNAGDTGVVITPTVPSLRNVLIPELRKWGYLEIGTWEPSKKRWTLPNGSTVIFESADNSRKIQRLRGPNIAWFGMDEPSSIAAEAWDIMVGRLRDGTYINAFVTGTPKGYNWVYDTFVGDDALDDVNLVHNIETSDNPHLPDVYTDQIVEQYEGRFYEQEVKGQFTDFEGLVYPWFGDENLVDAPPETYDEVIYGVDWGHNNPAVGLALVRRGDEWTVAEEWYERRCTIQDHSRAVAGLIDEYGEGPVYCDPAEPAHIEQFQRDGLPAKQATNDVTPGIQHVAGKADTLHVARHCQNVRNEFSQYQYKDGGDGDKPLKQHDHACFVEGTMVLTETGERPIETIRPGDRVLTREGYRPVLSAGKTAEDVEVVTATMTNGRKLTGTANHPVHTTDGFKPLLSLRYADLLTPTPRTGERCQKLTKSNFGESRSGATPSPTTGQTGTTTAPAETTLRMASKPSTERSGDITTARSPRDTSSITRMATRLTTILRTLSASLLKNTPKNIPSGAETPHGKLSTRRRTGTGRRKAASGTGSTPKNNGKAPNQRSKSANSVVTSSSTTPTPGSVQTPASRNGVGNRGSTTSKPRANGVERRSRITSTRNDDSVRVSAVRDTETTADVYNLTVLGQPEYYANGVLVHNCDALRYALYTNETRDASRSVSYSGDMTDIL